MPSGRVQGTHKDEEGREEQREVVLLELAQLDPAAGLQALEDRERFEEHRQDVVERDHGEGRQRRLHKGPKARADRNRCRAESNSASRPGQESGSLTRGGREHIPLA